MKPRGPSGLAALEISYRTAAAGRRDRAAIDRRRTAAKVAAAVGEGAGIGEGAALVTCVRTELYFASSAPEAWPERQRTAAEILGLTPSDLACTARWRFGRDAALHLFRVAAGLESPLPGEEAVLGQVREAHRLAAEAGSLGPVLSTVLQRSIHAGRRVRNETALGAGVASYAELGVDAARLAERGGRGVEVVLLGTGRLAAAVGGELAARHADGRLGDRIRLAVASRDPERAAGFAERFAGLGARPLRGPEALDSALVRADAVIGCTSSATPIVGAERLAAALERRRTGKALITVDLGYPPTVASLAPGAVARGELEQVTLDDLFAADGATGDGTFSARRRAIEEGAELVLLDEAAKLERWLEGRRRFATSRSLPTAKPPAFADWLTRPPTLEGTAGASSRDTTGAAR